MAARLASAWACLRNALGQAVPSCFASAHLDWKQKLAISVAAALAGIFLRGGQGHMMILVGCVAVAVPLGLAMAVWLVVGLKRDAEVPVRLEKAFRSGIATAGCLILSVISASAVHVSEVREARSFVASMLPRLEDYRSKHGRYPSALSDIQVSRVPSLLAKPAAYTGNGSYFRFEYREPFLLSVGGFFDSEALQWRPCDS